jgi:hypothetical protein
MTLAEAIADIGNVTTMVTDTSISLLDVFMQPPLIFFVGLALAGSIFYLVKGLLRRR